MNHADRNLRILVIDDDESVHASFRKIFAKRGARHTDSLDTFAQDLFGSGAPQRVDCAFELDFALQGQDGLALVAEARRANQPYSVVFTDIRMPPGWDGIETAERILKEDPEVQIVVCSAYSDYSTEDLLCRFDDCDRILILKKPFDVVEAVFMARTLNQKWHANREAGQLIQTQANELSESQHVISVVEGCCEELESVNRDLRDQADDLSDRIRDRAVEILAVRDLTVFGLAKLAESRDTETGEHLERMRAYAQVLAEYLAVIGPYTDQIDEQFLSDFYRSTPLHDIGKVGIPDSILLKPGRLTDNEFEVMKQHTTIGAEALECAIRSNNYGDFLQMAADIARYHHERFDGTGYPDGLKGLDIPLPARIVAVADVFDALTSKRVYKDASPVEQAKEIIDREASRHFDPVVVEAFDICFSRLLEARDSIGVEPGKEIYKNRDSHRDCIAVTSQPQRNP